MSYVERVAARAGSLSLSRVVLSAVAAPFYVLGFLLGLLLAACLWSWSAVAVGIADARARQSEPRQAGQLD